MMRRLSIRWKLTWSAFAVTLVIAVALAVVFQSRTHGHLLDHLEDTLELIRLHGHVSQLVGCSGWGVIGSRQEVEHAPGFSLILFSLPSEGFSVVPVSETQIEESSGPDYWRTVTGLSPEEVTSWILLANPYFGGAESWLADAVSHKTNRSVAEGGVDSICVVAAGKNHILTASVIPDDARGLWDRIEGIAAAHIVG